MKRENETRKFKEIEINPFRRFSFRGLTKGRALNIFQKQGSDEVQLSSSTQPNTRLVSKYLCYRHLLVEITLTSNNSVGIYTITISREGMH